LEVLIHRADDTIERMTVPFEATSRIYLFCHIAQLDACSFEYEDTNNERVFVQEDIEFERFAFLLNEKKILHIFEAKDDDIFIPDEQPHSSRLGFPDLVRVRLLGQGASGTCHLAINNRTGEKVAIKSIEWCEEEFVRKQLRRELDALRKCAQSPNIVKLLGEMNDGPVKLILFEYMDGGSLEQYGVIPPPVLSVVSYSLLDALIFMKRLKIFHRDIKRANVLVSLDGEVKLCDMGMSRVLPPNSSVADSYVGDNYYMPPERLLGLRYSTPSEIWGWAVVVCECALGRHPFLEMGEALPMDLMKIVDRIKKSHALTKYIPSEYGEDIVTMIAANTQFDPSSRWDLITLHRSPYIKQARTVSPEVAADWISNHPRNQ
ncbi:hypothetical protein PFISCL1PPCAC_4048, partial [Pristionchus fissidentatus]